MSDERNRPDPTDLPSTEAMSSSRGAGQIGPYRLLQKLGEGGMGEVWLAEQREPVKRKVALKVIKAGMDTKQVVARFETERQALAMMDHPAVAKVFDAGTTPRGLPYFVMEYVKGVPINRHCDTHRLSTRERLELFQQVCEGVQHAHQKAIRDDDARRELRNALRGRHVMGVYPLAWASFPGPPAHLWRSVSCSAVA